MRNACFLFPGPYGHGLPRWDADISILLHLGPCLSWLVRGVPRARPVLTVVREFAPANAAWLTMLLNAWFAEQFIEMAFKRLYPRAEMPGAPLPLTDRQVQVGDLAVQGLGNKQIADRLGLTPAQVQEALKVAYRRAGVRTRWELMAQRRDQARTT